LNSASNLAEPNYKLPEWLRLEFSNTSNLKDDIQNRISVDIGTYFIEALNNLKGDNFDSGGICFSEITRLALAYFYSEIFKDKIENKFYSVQMVKGFFDGNNLTNYTAIHEIDTVFYKLKDAKYFKHCYLVIQCAWYFNSIHFGSHQHIEYLNHYIKTKEKLPLENYKFDSEYLLKKYSEIDQRASKPYPINEVTFVNKWYHCILFLVWKELNLPTTNFNVTIKDNREFNPLTKTSRQLRSLSPFKLNECDIQSAFPTFIDVIIGSNLKNEVYHNLMMSKNINRNNAKVLFNKTCNSGLYISESEALYFFQECGYTKSQSDAIIKLTHYREKKFYSHMTKLESRFIEQFKAKNDLMRGTRLHDAIFFLDNTFQPCTLQIDNCNFKFKEINQPIFLESFELSSKMLPYAYIKSIPNGFHFVSEHTFQKTEKKGDADGFRFFKSKYAYLSAGFNCNNYKLTESAFLEKCNNMFGTIYRLNQNSLEKRYITLILNHIREKSNLVFNVRALLLKIGNTNFENFETQIKYRDWEFTKNLKFKKTIDFLNALNNARGKVFTNCNFCDLRLFLHERINNNDYEFLTELRFSGRKSNNLLPKGIVNLFNFLCTGYTRNTRNSNKSYPLYISSIKRVTINPNTSKYKTFNATLVRSTKRYEKELKEFNRLIRNREKIPQLYLLVCEILNVESELEIEVNELIQNELKIQLLQMLNKSIHCNFKISVHEFDIQFIPEFKNQLPKITNLKEIFDNNLENSIFNIISIEDAYSKGLIFFQEYLKFNKIGEEIIETTLIEKPKEKYILPKFDFDE
jgi:hypothetical protein